MEGCELTETASLPGSECDLLLELTPAKHDPQQRHRAVAVMGRRAAVVPDASLLLADAATLLLEMLQADVCEIGELAADAETLHLRLQGRGKTPLRGPQTVPCDGSQSLAGFAIRTAHPVVVTELAGDSRFADPLLRKAAVVSAVCVPLRIQNRVYGAIAACFTSPRQLSQDDVFFAEAIGHLLSATTARKEAEQQLAQERQMAEGVLQTVDALVVTLDSHGQITRINRAGERLTGFAAGDLLHRSIWSVFPVPQEVDLYRSMLEQIQGGKESVEFESSLLTKHSQRKIVAWSWRATGGETGQLDSILATGIDVTGWREAEQRAQHAERLVGIASSSGETMELADEEVEQFRKVMAGQASCRSALRIPTADGSNERRTRPRRAYPYHQLIAPMFNGNLPGRDKFKHIACHDISSGGFSFISSTPPTSDTFVVALGNPPDLIYLMAQVAHVTRTEAEGARMYLIGCNYLGRVNY